MLTGILGRIIDGTPEPHRPCLIAGLTAYLLTPGDIVRIGDLRHLLIRLATPPGYDNWVLRSSDGYETRFATHLGAYAHVQLKDSPAPELISSAPAGAAD